MFHIPHSYPKKLVECHFEKGNLRTSCIFTLQAMHSLGLRKFFLAGIGPLGCIPNQRAMAPPGRCMDSVNQMLGTFNEGLRAMVDQLNRNHPGAIFAYGNTYAAFGDILNNPAAYCKIHKIPLLIQIIYP